MTNEVTIEQLNQLRFDENPEICQAVLKKMANGILDGKFHYDNFNFMMDNLPKSIQKLYANECFLLIADEKKLIECLFDEICSTPPENAQATMFYAFLIRSKLRNFVMIKILDMCKDLKEKAQKNAKYKNLCDFGFSTFDIIPRGLPQEDPEIAIGLVKNNMSSLLLKRLDNYQANDFPTFFLEDLDIRKDTDRQIAIEIIKGKKNDSAFFLTVLDFLLRLIEEDPNFAKEAEKLLAVATFNLIEGAEEEKLYFTIEVLKKIEPLRKYLPEDTIAVTVLLIQNFLDLLDTRIAALEYLQELIKDFDAAKSVAFFVQIENLNIRIFSLRQTVLQLVTQILNKITVDAFGGSENLKTVLDVILYVKHEDEDLRKIDSDHAMFDLLWKLDKIPAYQEAIKAFGKEYCDIYCNGYKTKLLSGFDQFSFAQSMICLDTDDWEENLMYLIEDCSDSNEQYDNTIAQILKNHPEAFDKMPFATKCKIYGLSNRLFKASVPKFLHDFGKKLEEDKELSKFLLK